MENISFQVQLIICGCLVTLTVFNHLTCRKFLSHSYVQGHLARNTQTENACLY